jgi:COP9 signalosome complex subunit 7
VSASEQAISIHPSHARVFRAATTSSVLAQLDTQLSNLSSQKLANKTNLQLHEESLHATIREVSDKIKEGKGTRRNVGLSSALGMAGVGGEDRMDVDDPMGPSGGMEGVRAKKWK